MLTGQKFKKKTLYSWKRAPLRTRKKIQVKQQRRPYYNKSTLGKRETTRQTLRTKIASKSESTIKTTGVSIYRKRGGENFF